MTAARFVLLCVMRLKAIVHGDFATDDPLRIGMAQREIWSRLDVDKSTVSKMLRRLEEMGWIRRERSKAPGDYRTKKVFFTKLGLQRIAKAMRIMFRQRTLLKYFERIFKAGNWRFKHVVKNLQTVSESIQYVADCFGDRSIVCYDYGPLLDEGPWDFWDYRKRLPFHPLYVPCPMPRMPPVRKGPRLPKRPFEFTDYENAIRDVIWGTEKRRRRPRADHPKI